MDALVPQVWQKNHVGPVVEQGLCTMCGACAGMCPRHCIDLSLNHRTGIYVPTIDFSQCTDCGVCLMTCPGHEVGFGKLSEHFLSHQSIDPYVGHYINCYLGWASDEQIRRVGSSGGIVSALLVFALQHHLIDGALVTKISQAVPLVPQAYIARTQEEMLAAAGSKYAPVAVDTMLEQIQKEDAEFAIVGLPCHIQGVRKAQLFTQSLHERVLTIGLFCGYGKTFLATDYVLRKHGIDKESVQRVAYRSDGWPGSMHLGLVGGETRHIEFRAFYNSEFASFSPLRCILCSDVTNELADIACGDAWLPEYAGEARGVSIVITRSLEGEALVRQAIAEGALHLVPTTAEVVFRAQQAPLLRKKRRLRAFFTLLRMLGRDTPSYDQLLLDPTPGDYVRAIIQYMSLMIAGRPRLRFLMRIHPILRGIRNVLRGRSRNLRDTAS